MSHNGNGHVKAATYTVVTTGAESHEVCHIASGRPIGTFPCRQDACNYVAWATAHNAKVSGFLGALDGTSPACRTTAETRVALDNVFNLIVRPRMNGRA